MIVYRKLLWNGAKMKKLLCVLMSMLVTLTSLAFVFGVGVSAAENLSEDELLRKNYPLPEGYEITSLLTFDDGGSVDEGTFYDTASKKVTTYKSGDEASSFASPQKFYGSVGLMFWYKSDNGATIRVRDTSNNSIIIEGTLPACSEGKWVTYYYYCKCINFTFKTDMKKDIREKVNANPNSTYQLKFMNWGSGEQSSYIDEFFTFSPIKTKADTYDNDEQAQKFSLARIEKQTNTITKHYDDGSVELTSTFGSTINNTPINVTYNPDKEQFLKAVNIAKQGSGYLQIKCDNISCKNSNNEDAYGLITVKFDGIDKTIKKYSYSSESSDIYLLDVKDIENIDGFTGINIKIEGSIKDVDFKFSPITVFHFKEDEIILQAETLNPKVCSRNNEVTDANIYIDDDKNRTYVNCNEFVNYLSFDLPKLEVGEYEVYASVAAVKSSTRKYNISVNNLRQLVDVLISDDIYVRQRHNINISLGKLKITKDYDKDGFSQLKFTNVPKASAGIYIDYFSFTKTNTVVAAEPSSNFAVKPYPEIEDYELKTVLNTYDSYICSNDDRYYLNNQIAGYIGDGNAYNLNSRCTANKAWFDNNDLWSNSNKPLDGDALRFWYKGGNAILQLRGNNTTYSYKLTPKTGEWVTVYYKDIVPNGDLSFITSVMLKPDSVNSYYVDELHTIQQKLGDVKYELNGDGTASVVGYNLRLENVEIANEYKGCPVTSIKNGALSGSLTLKSVKLPDTITKIESKAFADDPNLETVIFDKNLKTIEDEAFLNCADLIDVSLPSSVTYLSNTAFSGCTALYLNVVNDSYIKEYAVNNRIDYKCVTTDGINYYCDYNSENTNINIIGYIGKDSVLNIPSKIDGYSVVLLDSGCFENNSVIKSLVVPNSVSEIKDCALKNCSSLEEVSMLNVTKIGDEAFLGCNSLTKVLVSNELISVGNKSFYNDNKINEFYFSDNLNYIGDNAFVGCEFVAKLSDSAYDTKNSYSYNFVNSNGFVHYPPTNSDFSYYIINNYGTICGYKGNSAKINVPEKIDDYNIQNIGEDAFKDNKNLVSIKLSSIRNIYKNAFNGCSNLSNVTLPNELRTINEYSFSYCLSLKSIEVNNVVTIDSTAFYGSPTKIVRIQTDFIRNALDYVDGMTAGWNLGNTLDAHSSQYSYGDLTVYQSEHLWRKNDYISQELFDLVAEKFNTIRIPITWNAFIDPNNDYKIDDAFMDRIQEVVEMCYNAGFKYIIINTHHDSDYYFNPHPSKNIDLACSILSKVWTQIGNRFANYDEKLIFESMNEIRSQGSDVGGNGDWNGNSTLYARYNQLNKSFFDTVRSLGGNNKKRYLMMQTYAGVRDDGQINSLANWLTSADGVKDDNHIIASTHWYIETLNEKDYTYKLSKMKTRFVDAGIPCVIGETGLPTYYDNKGNITVYNDDYREKWCKFFFGLLEQYKLKGIIWDDHGTYSTMLSNPYQWKFPKYVDAIYEATKKPEENTECKVSIDGTEYITVNKGNEVTLPVSTLKNFVCYSNGKENFEENEKIIVDSDLELKSYSLGDLKMLSGASMRLKVNDGGIRYYTNVDEAAISNLRKLGLTVDLGTLIAPKDLLLGKELTFDNVSIYTSGKQTNSFDALNVEYTSDKYFEENTFVGSISKVKSYNIDREFIGRGYVKLLINNKERVFYADFADNNVENNTRTIRNIAIASRNKNGDDYKNFKSIIDFYADYN